MTQSSNTEISYIIKEKITKELNDFFDNEKVSVKSEGIIVKNYDGVLIINGLEDIKYGELINIKGGSKALALNLEEDSIGAVIIGKGKDIIEGTKVYSTGKVLEVPVGKNLLGRIVDALGNPIDGKGDLKTEKTDRVEKVAPGVIDRKSVSQPLQTGIKSIDSMVPIGRGQRELIIGDRQIGKTAIAIDTIINQKKTGVKCIYVAIGQKQSSIVSIVKKLEDAGVLDNTIVVVAGAAASASEQYLAPFTGCTMGEYFRDRGEDALIIYDDLSKQAVAYRQISLLLRRPPGREAYPGDIFYLHSRLLERAARVNEAYVEKFTGGKVKNKTGSLTALPIIETQAGDVSAFVSTNVISITDGQIFLDTDLFNSGNRPAINVGLSVSRVGGSAQTALIKKLGGTIRITLAQYREQEAFSQFAADLDEKTREQLNHGKRVTEIMKQPQYFNLSVAEMGLILFAVNNGFCSDLEIKDIKKFEEDLIRYARANYSDLLDILDKEGIFNDEIKSKLDNIIKSFKDTLIS